MSYAKVFTGHKLLTHVDSYLQEHLKGRDYDRWDSTSRLFYEDDEGYGWERVAKNHPENIDQCLDSAKTFLNDLGVTIEDVKNWM